VIRPHSEGDGTNPIPRLKFREYEDRKALTVLAEACGATKEYEERLKVLLDYMSFAGGIAREGDDTPAAH
jgi:hypothetical protein